MSPPAILDRRALEEGSGRRPPARTCSRCAPRRSPSSCSAARDRRRPARIAQGWGRPRARRRLRSSGRWRSPHPPRRRTRGARMRPPTAPSPRFLHARYGEPSMQTFTVAAVAGWRDDLTVRGLSASTVAQRVSAVRRLAAALGADPLVAQVRCTHVQQERPTALPRRNGGAPGIGACTACGLLRPPPWSVWAYP